MEFDIRFIKWLIGIDEHDKLFNYEKELLFSPNELFNHHTFKDYQTNNSFLKTNYRNAYLKIQNKFVAFKPDNLHRVVIASYITAISDKSKAKKFRDLSNFRKIYNDMPQFGHIEILKNENLDDKHINLYDVFRDNHPYGHYLSIDNSNKMLNVLIFGLSLENMDDLVLKLNNKFNTLNNYSFEDLLKKKMGTIKRV